MDHFGRFAISTTFPILPNFGEGIFSKKYERDEGGTGPGGGGGFNLTPFPRKTALLFPQGLSVWCFSKIFNYI